MRRKRQAGLLLGWRDKRCKQYYCNGEDTHSLVIGATRCGKTRCNVLPTLVLQALAGESMINVDPKGELCGYTKELLELLEYEVIPLDFRDPTRSSRYNFLQPVLDAVLLEEAIMAQLHTDCKTGLSAETCQKAVGFFLYDNTLDCFSV